MSAGHFELLSKDVGVPLVCFRLKKVTGSDGGCCVGCFTLCLLGSDSWLEAAVQRHTFAGTQQP